jgi:hypothetical protein
MKIQWKGMTDCCAQVLNGVTFELLAVAGMRTEFELQEIFLDFTRQPCIPSALQWDYAKSEMSLYIQ